MDSPPLLSKGTLLELGMLKIDPEETLKFETNDLRIKSVKAQTGDIQDVIDEYSSVFEGIRVFRLDTTVATMLGRHSSTNPLPTSTNMMVFLDLSTNDTSKIDQTKFQDKRGQQYTQSLLPS